MAQTESHVTESVVTRHKVTVTHENMYIQSTLARIVVEKHLEYTL